MTTPLEDKKALRARMRAVRDAFAKDAPPLGVPAAFAERLLPGLSVAAYVAIGGEADPAPLVAAARARGCSILLPYVVDRATPLRFLEWDGTAQLEAGPFGLMQPTRDSVERAPDIIIAPLVAFDHRLDRLGQGGGHYDRAFARFPDAWRIGVAWSVQEVPSIPAETWDVPLHAVITETGMIAHHEGGPCA